MTEIKARPTLYKGIRMRSRLEADFARYLDALGNPWDYEPECFASDTGQWLPDFRTVLPTDAGGYRNVYLELKPAAALALQDGEAEIAHVARIDVILKRMLIAWSSEPSAALELISWTFGENGPDFAVLRVREWPWMAWDGRNARTMWPGMGQGDDFDAVYAGLTQDLAAERHARRRPATGGRRASAH
jgi:hypothetical protein